MKNATILAAILAITLVGAAMGDPKPPFAPNVNTETGALRVPENYTEWPTLGTWTHAHTGETLEKMGPGVHEYHVVYTQPETITYYRKHGRFPDGAVLVKELLDAKTMAMTTGPAVGHATTIKGWFVLVRDTKGRYKESSLWGMVGHGRSSMRTTLNTPFRRTIRPIVFPVTRLRGSLPIEMLLMRISGSIHSVIRCCRASNQTIR